MFGTEVSLRKWGKSIGVVIPKEDIINEKLKAGDKIKIIILKKNNVLKETFGIAKAKTPTEKLLKESNKDLYPSE